MEIRYNVTGARRKELVKVISDTTGARAEYKFMPTCNYEIDYFTVTKDGTLLFDDMADTEEVEQVLTTIADAGFECEAADSAALDTDAEDGGAAQDANVGCGCPVDTSCEARSTDRADRRDLTVRIPLDKVAVGNLTRLLEVKGTLIKKALGIADLPIRIEEDAVDFPWFAELPSADEVNAYTHFIAALCEMSKNQKRITATEKTVDNEKYAFRCFLLRLGFIGAEFKTERKILLRNLSGSSAFKSGQRKTEAPKPQPPIPAVDWDAENREDAMYIAAVNAEMDAQVPGGESDAISE